MLSSFNAQFAHPQGWLGQLAGWLMALKNRERNAWAVELLEVRSTDHILEIGFGPGWAIQQLRPQVANGHIAGIDSSEAMLRQASLRNAKAIRAGQVELRLGSNAPLPYPVENFDKVLAVNSTQFWPDLLAGLQEIRRVLKRDGKVVLTYQPPYGTDEDAKQMGRQLLAQIRLAGFRQVCVETKALQPVIGVSIIGTK